MLTALVLALAAAGGLWAALTGVGPARLDAALLDESVEERTGGLNAAAVLVTDVGSTIAMAVLAVVVGLWCWYRGRRADAVLVVGAMAGASLVFRGLKMLFDRPRPPAATQVVSETNQSLPSGHATMSIVVIGSLVVLAWAGRGVAARVAMVTAAAVWVGAVGATRIYLGVHWFSDVLAGWLVGATWLALCVTVWSHRRRRRLGPPGRVLYLRTFRDDSSDDAMVVALGLGVRKVGRLIVIGPAESRGALHAAWAAAVGDGLRFEEHVECIDTVDADWRRAVHHEIARADCILLHLSPKADEFPWSEAPRLAPTRPFDDYYASPVGAPASGVGLMYEIAYLDRLGRVGRTVVLCAQQDGQRVKQLIDRLPVPFFARSEQGHLRALDPRPSALDRSLGELRRSARVITYSSEQLGRPATSTLRWRIGAELRRVVAERPRVDPSPVPGVPRPEDILGVSPEPRRMSPDGEQKIIRFTNVEDLIRIPPWEITDLPLDEVERIIGPEQVAAGCPSCDTAITNVFCYRRGLHPGAGDPVKGRCQRCNAYFAVEDGGLIWM